MALVHELVELMEGTITAKSELGKGAEFVVLLPIHTRVTQPLNSFETIDLSKKHANLLSSADLMISNNNPIVNTDAADGLSDNSKPQILIAEDNPDVIFYICSVLEPFYDITTATNGAEGIEKPWNRFPT